MKKYATIFEYSVDDDVAIYLYDTEEEAKKMLMDCVEEAIKINDEDNECELYVDVNPYGTHAAITKDFGNDDVERVYIRVGKIYE